MRAIGSHKHSSIPSSVSPAPTVSIVGLQWSWRQTISKTVNKAGNILPQCGREDLSLRTLSGRSSSAAPGRRLLLIFDQQHAKGPHTSRGETSSQPSERCPRIAAFRLVKHFLLDSFLVKHFLVKPRSAVSA